MTTTTQEKTGLIARTGKFFTEVRHEGRRVSWPEKVKARDDVFLVILVSAVLGVLIGFQDFLLSLVFKFLLH